jgi:hypothetical protein
MEIHVYKRYILEDSETDLFAIDLTRQFCDKVSANHDNVEAYLDEDVTTDQIYSET